MPVFEVVNVSLLYEVLEFVTLDYGVAVIFEKICRRGEIIYLVPAVDLQVPCYLSNTALLTMKLLSMFTELLAHNICNLRQLARSALFMSKGKQTIAVAWIRVEK